MDPIPDEPFDRWPMMVGVVRSRPHWRVKDGGATGYGPATFWRTDGYICEVAARPIMRDHPNLTGKEWLAWFKEEQQRYFDTYLPELDAFDARQVRYREES